MTDDEAQELLDALRAGPSDFQRKPLDQSNEKRMVPVVRWVQITKGEQDARDKRQLANMKRFRKADKYAVMASARQHVICPRCDMQPGFWCVTKTNKPTVEPHVARRDLARAVLVLEGIEMKEPKKFQRVKSITVKLY